MTKESSHVLVVEDELYVQGMLEDFLSRSGYRVTVVPTAEKAFEAMEEEVFHLILLDKNLPDMSGVEVLSQIRFNNPDLPVIFMTGYPSERSRLMVQHLGVSEYFEKPVNLRVLVQTIETALSSSAEKETEETNQVIVVDIQEILNKPQEKDVVLIVSDSREINTSIKGLSSRNDFLVAVSGEVDKVYDFLQEKTAHVLVVDLGLPGGNSPALARWAVQKHPTISIMGLYRKTEDSMDAKSFSEALGIRYMIKLPLDSTQELLTKMEILLKRTRTLRAFNRTVS